MPAKSRKAKKPTSTIQDSNPGVIAVRAWGDKNEILPEHIDSLLEDGFTTIACVKLVEKADLGPDIPRGQQKLLLQAVKTLHGAQAGEPNTPATGETPAAIAETTNAPPDTATPAAGGDLYTQGISALLGLQGVQPNQENRAPGLQQASWSDPQIHLQMASSRAGRVKALQIVDFCDGASEPDHVVSSEGGIDIVVRTRRGKPTLEDLPITQWTIANLAIMNTLVNEGVLDKTGMLDYLSYTTRVLQLLGRYQAPSVYMYDREYRTHQAQYQFRWGTEIGHLATVYLRPIYSNTSRPSSTRQEAQAPARSRVKGPVTTNGQEICKNFNKAAGCTLRQCKFMHVCSVPGCEEKHSAITHPAKNSISQ